MGQPVGPLVEFLVGPLPRAVDQGQRVGRLLRLALEALMHAQVGRIVPRRVVPLDEQLTAFGLGQQRELRDRQVRLRDDSFQKDLEVLQHAADRAGTEQLGAVIGR